MVERERTHTSHQPGELLLAALPHILECVWCGGSTWHAATLDQTSIVYHCAACGAGLHISYDATARSWTVMAEGRMAATTP